VAAAVQLQGLLSIHSSYHLYSSYFASCSGMDLHHSLYTTMNSGMLCINLDLVIAVGVGYSSLIKDRN
jgi:hypothetical protein